MTPGLRPLSGSAREIEGLVKEWLAETDPRPLWVRTSGSTGEPKDVALSASAVLASARATLSFLGGPGDWLLALPAHYVAGLQVIVRSVVSGRPVVLLDDFGTLGEATAALGAGRRYLAAVPTQLTRWLADPDEAAALRSYDRVLVGGSATSAGLLADAAAAGVTIVTTYGMSETSGGCVYDGIPLDGVGVALDSAGRVRLSGPVLFDGYVGRPDLTAEVLVDGWLVTPDLGYLDNEGRLVVTGRADDVVVSGGVNVALPAVERVVAGLPEVRQAAVVSTPDPEWGARVVAVVSLVDVGAGSLSLTAVRDAVGAEHPRSWAPRALVIVEQVPMLESGKVDRAAVVKLVERQ
jgi:O-succinylbenzoic acid--CoA ligase